jgi:hypothetical protein
MRRCKLDLSGSEQGVLKTSGYTKRWEYLDQLNNDWLLENDCSIGLIGQPITSAAYTGLT